MDRFFKIRPSHMTSSVLLLSLLSGFAHGASSDETSSSKQQTFQPFSYVSQTITGAHDAGQLIHIDRTQSGGFSAMWASDDCQQFLFVSDYSQVPEDELALQPVRRSMWYQTLNTFDPKGHLRSMTVTQSGALKALDGTTLKGAAESIFWNGDGYVVSFDDTGDLWLYPSKTPFGNIFEVTPTIYKQQASSGLDNDGLETIAKLKDGTIISIWEKTKRDELTATMNIIEKDSKQSSWTLQAVSNPKDATVLEDGTLVILEKDWLREKGSRLRFSLLAEPNYSNWQVDQIVNTKNVFDLTAIDYDNFEGMASCTIDNKERIFIVSDDNGDWPKRHFEDKNIPRQKTLLLSFQVQDLINSTKLSP